MKPRGYSALCLLALAGCATDRQVSNSAAYVDPGVAQCQAVMRTRPMTTPSPTTGATWGDVNRLTSQALNERAAAINLCATDPQAYLKPLPWESSAPSQPTDANRPAVCFYQNGVLVCP
jgi:hypothetical protein